MSYHPGAICGGVRSLEDIRARCRIDEETGCWLWGMAQHIDRGRPGTYGRTYLPDHGEPRHASAHRAAWLVSGRKLPKGHIVWRSLCAGGLCCNPQHCKSGTAADKGRDQAMRGTLKGNVNRRIQNQRNARKNMTPAHVVERAVAMFASGMAQKAVAAELGIAKDTARKIRLGTHPHCAGRSLVRGASVFALAA